ncbi:MAG: hypothetical protein M5U25_21055 [Planctomycetota bacterium]|nr:hypothetical protein [Planctomycetota bacterium]
MKLPLHPAKDTKAQREYRLNIILDLVAEGVTVTSACKKAGVSKKTFYAWMNTDPELLSRYEAALIDRHNDVAEVIQLCALKALSDPRYQTSAIFYAKCKMGWQDGSGFTSGAQDMPSINFKKSSSDKVTNKDGDD